MGADQEKPCRFGLSGAAAQGCERGEKVERISLGLLKISSYERLPF
jgi:hypothetical protein